MASGRFRTEKKESRIYCFVHAYKNFQKSPLILCSQKCELDVRVLCQMNRSMKMESNVFLFQMSHGAKRKGNINSGKITARTNTYCCNWPNF